MVDVDYVWDSYFGQGAYPTLGEAVAAYESFALVVAVYGSDVDETLAYYDVETQQLHVGATPEALGIVVMDSTPLSFKADGSGKADRARILLIPQSDDAMDARAHDYRFCPLPAEAVDYPTGLRRRMKSEIPAEIEHDEGTWAALIQDFLGASVDLFDDNEAVYEGFAKNLQYLQYLRDLWPSGFQRAYTFLPYRSVKSVFLPSFYYDPRPPLVDFHLPHIVEVLNPHDKALLRYSSPDLVGQSARALALIASARTLFLAKEAEEAWRSSRRCVWIVACVQGCLEVATREAEDAEKLSRDKRKCLETELP